MNYNLEKQDAQVLRTLVNKIGFYHHKNKDKPDDDVLSVLAETKDMINQILKGTIYE